MPNISMKIRTDETTKQQIEEFARSVSLSVSALVIAVMKQTMKEKRVALTPIVENPKLYEKCMRKAEREYEAQLKMAEEGRSLLDNLYVKGVVPR